MDCCEVCDSYPAKITDIGLYCLECFLNYTGWGMITGRRKKTHGVHNKPKRRKGQRPKKKKKNKKPQRFVVTIEEITDGDL